MRNRDVRLLAVGGSGIRGGDQGRLSAETSPLLLHSSSQGAREHSSLL